MKQQFGGPREEGAMNGLSAVETSWDFAAGLLSEAVLISVTSFPSWDWFLCYHPTHGELHIVLGSFSTGLVGSEHGCLQFCHEGATGVAPGTVNTCNVIPFRRAA